MELSKTRNQYLMSDHFTTFKIGRKSNNYKVQKVAFKPEKLRSKETFA